MFSWLFYKISDGLRVRLVKSLHSVVFFNQDIWEGLIDYEIELLINFHEQKKKPKKIDLFSGNPFKNFASLLEDYNPKKQT